MAALAIATFGSLVVFALFLTVDIVSMTPPPENSPNLPIWAAIWSAPMFVYAALVRTRWMAVHGGLGLLAATVARLLTMFATDDVTVTIGLMVYPPMLCAGGLVALGIDRMVLARRAGDLELVSNGLLGYSLVGGAITALVAVQAVAKLVNTTAGDHPLPLSIAALGGTLVMAMIAVRQRLALRANYTGTGPPTT